MNEYLALIIVYLVGAPVVFVGFIWRQVKGDYPPTNVTDASVLVLFGAFFSALWPIYGISFGLFLLPGWVLLKISDRVNDRR